MTIKALPTNDEGPTVGAVGPLENKQNNKPDFHGARQSAQDLSYTDKTRATLAALLAIKGYSLHELADGSFWASRWNCVRCLPDLHAVQRFARQVGAA